MCARQMLERFGGFRLYSACKSFVHCRSVADDPMSILAPKIGTPKHILADFSKTALKILIILWNDLTTQPSVTQIYIYIYTYTMPLHVSIN
jgi:hypothetical protein